MRAQPNIPSRTTVGARYRSWNFHAFGIPSFGRPGLGRRIWDRRVWGAGFGAPGLERRCLPLRGKVRAAPPGVNVLDLLFSRRRVPFCRKRLFRTEKRATVPCVRCLALWARDAAGVRGRRCLPCGQRRCRVARRILACRGKSRVSVRFTHQEIFPARRGAGNGLLPARNGVFPARRLLYVLPMSLSPQETEIRPISQTKRAPYSCKTFHVYPSAANAALYKSLLIAPSFRGEHPARPKPSFPRPQNHNFPPFPPPSHPPTIPQGERRALPAPAQGSRPLRIPFGGAALISPVARPPNAAGGKSLLVDLPPCIRSTAGTETKRSKSAPCSWGGLA